MHSKLIPIFILSIIILSSISFNTLTQSIEPIYVVFIWHYHQPWYYTPDNTSFILPWVRLHSVGNYYKMAYILKNYPDIKVTFTFSGSLLKQILDYVYGGKRDYRWVLSQKVAIGENLTVDEKFNIIRIPGGFFDINWNRIVNAVPRYRELRDRVQQLISMYIQLPEDLFKKKVVENLTDQDFIDLVCLFNLFWIDPQVLKDLHPELYNIRQEFIKGSRKHCEREVIEKVLKVHLEIMGRVISIYRELLKQNQIELIPVPYGHPLAPLLTDFGLNEDLELHIELSINLFREIFNYSPIGIWPAEQAVNDEVLKLFAKAGLRWTVTDDTILYKTVPDVPRVSIDGGVYATESLWRAIYTEGEIYVLFRNSFLSNLISFTYGQQSSTTAAQDLVDRLRRLAKTMQGKAIIIALDGENPWENYEEFGDVFLNTLYSLLTQAQKEGVLKTITPRELIELKKGTTPTLQEREFEYLNLKGADIADTPTSYLDDAYKQLPRSKTLGRIAEGSWAGGELAMWIGQRQENAAWMLLVKTREDLLRTLNVNSSKEAMKLNPQALTYLLMAESSDWFWWYGGDAGGTFPANPLFKGYLQMTYRLLGVEPPSYIKALFNPDGTPVWSLNTDVPKPLEREPELDGILNEDLWNRCLKISVGTIVTNAYIGITAEHLVLGIEFGNRSLSGVLIAVYLSNWWKSVSPYHIGYNSLLRDGSTAPMALAYEILIDPENRIVEIYTADGMENWVRLFRVSSAAFGKKAIEALIPWSMLSLMPSDYSYILVVTYVGGKIVEKSERIGGVHLIQVPRAIVAIGGRVVVDVNDPEGDDDGAGGYAYPHNPVFKPGVFDLLRFRVIDVGTALKFEFYFKDLGGNPWNGPNGFSLQYIHVYIRTTTNMPCRNDTFGLNVVLENNSAWHIAILIAPGWGADPVPKGERAAIYYYNDSVIVQDKLFKVYADHAANSIIAEIDKSLLPDVDHADKWIYTVIVTSYDGYGPQRIRPFGVEAQEWVVGTGTRYALAIMFNVVPRVMDLLALTKEEQYAMLNSFTINREKGIAYPAKVRGISVEMISKPTIITATYTTTVTSTYTVISTTTMMKTKTETNFITITSPTTVTYTQREMLNVGLGIATAFLATIALILAYLLFKKR